MSKNNEGSPAADLAGIAGLGTAAGLLGHSGLGDINNRNVLVSYGNAPASGVNIDMGAGHREPARQIKSLLEEIRQENQGNALGQLNVVDSPIMNYAGDLSEETRRNIGNKKFLTGIDTGWGLFDAERPHQIPGRTEAQPPLGMNNLLDRATGKLIKQRDPLFMRRFRNFLSFQPDGRSDSTGYLASGDAVRTKGMANHVAATFGDFDPSVTSALSGGKLRYMGRAHPLVELEKLPGLMDRPAYESFLSNHLNKHGFNVTPEQLQGKKIITVSGASRGDTVGARARWVAEALKAKGHNPDDYVIVGLGGRTPKLREDVIAHAGGRQPNIFIAGGTSGPNGPSEFNSLIGNSDLHVMGMGGSAPFEALAHGGAPIAVFDDEQVFKAREKVPWSDSTLMPERGIHGYENKLRELANAGLAPEHQLAESAPRAWMNKAVHEENGVSTTVRKGLDGIRNYLGLRGAQTLQSDNFDSFHNVLQNLASHGGDTRAQHAALTMSDIAAGRQNVKGLLLEQLTKARRSSLLHGGGKLALGAGAVAGAGALLSRLLGSGNEPAAPQTVVSGAKPGLGMLAGTGGLPFRFLGKQASGGVDGSDFGIGAGVGTALVGAGLYDTGGQLAKVRGIARPYVNAVNDYLRKYPHGFQGVDPTQMRDFLRTMDHYGDAAHAMSNLRVMGVPAHHITSKFPLASLAGPQRNNAILNGIGLGSLVDPAARWELQDMQAHYAGAGDNSKDLLAREMLGYKAHKETRLTPEVAKVMGADEAAKIVSSPKEVSLLERFAPYIDRVEKGQVNGNQYEINSPFVNRDQAMLRGLNHYTPGDIASMSLHDILKARQTNGVKGYGLLVSAIAKKLSPRLKGVGLALGALGAGAAGLGISSKLQSGAKDAIPAVAVS